MLMIICQVIDNCFDKVVQNIFDPVSIAYRVFLFSCVLVLPACNNWPDPAERTLAVSHRQADIPVPVNHKYIESLMNISKVRLGFLISSGAQYCLPGQVNIVNKFLLRAKHEVDGNLLLDAQYTLAKAMEHLNSFSELMFSLAEGSECLEAFEYRKENNYQLTAYIDSLNSLLNCQCDQISNEESLVESFSSRLEIVAKSLSAHVQLKMNIYAVEQSGKIQEIIMFLSNIGVRKEQVRVFYEGFDKAQISEDGLLFEVLVAKGRKNYKVKDWQKDLKYKVLQKGDYHGI